MPLFINSVLLLKLRCHSARAGKARRITLEEFCDRACEISKLYGEARLVEDEAYKLEDRIERILGALIRERARAEGL